MRQLFLKFDLFLDKWLHLKGAARCCDALRPHLEQSVCEGLFSQGQCSLLSMALLQLFHLFPSP